MPTITHIVNGDAFGDKLRASGIDGDILVWRESLYEGPIGMKMSDQALLALRAAYMHERHGIPKTLFIATSLEQEHKLDALASSADELVLWFEHDLYDQWMLVYLLSRMAPASARPFQLSLLCIDRFPGVDTFYGLGQLSLEQIRTLHGAWDAVTEPQRLLACRAWSAYSAAEPLALAELLAEDLSALPCLRQALQLHLGRFPSTQNGLSTLEQLTLGLIGDAEVSVLSLFRDVAAQALEYGLGDLQFWGMLNRFWKCEKPLVSIAGTERLPSFGEALALGFEGSRAKLTKLGREVLEGRLDNIQLNGIDDWIGGVRMFGKGEIWRRNSLDNRLVRR
ncbi:DUF1835 domain-containing protein [Paenibacillus whitsoniae]|uniref:DUF1835 domain-containing protein n=1 Tax=Paenibacillus whitsoniae TaxID=2496558 RepID=A0A430J3R5_9BACL|nr:DUF1835 domain-containing protein [Paenibacillus whitsoniae]RTE00179.1 DUF1835 domain-containing protein [Paenibacillus whitsoniae]